MESIMKTKIQLLTVALFTLFFCPTTTICMEPKVRILTKLMRNYATRVIKLGGSVLTNKEQTPDTVMDFMIEQRPDGIMDYSFVECMAKQRPDDIMEYDINYPSMENLAEQIADYLYDDSEEKHVILVTGAGAQAHKTAKKHQQNLRNATQEIWEQTEEVAHEMIAQVNKQFDKHQIDKLAVFINSRDIIMTENGKIKDFDTTILDKMKSQNMIPFLNATLTFNEMGELEILSGDAITLFLAEHENVKPGFVSKMGGLYDENGRIEVFDFTVFGHYNVP